RAGRAFSWRKSPTIPREGQRQQQRRPRNRERLIVLATLVGGKLPTKQDAFNSSRSRRARRRPTRSVHQHVTEADDRSATARSATLGTSCAYWFMFSRNSKLFSVLRSFSMRNSAASTVFNSFRILRSNHTR